jgi:hypothetical protein
LTRRAEPYYTLCDSTSLEQRRCPMADIERIDVDEARSRTRSGDALLVCAYDDDAKCAAMALEGAIPMSALRARTASLPKDQELIFYCA